MNAQRTSRPVTLTFGAVMISFLFSFANVSCQGQRVASLTGVQLAFGTTISRSDMWGNKQDEKVPAEPLALFGLVAAVAGFGLSIMRPATRRATALIGGTGALMLMVLISKLAREMSAKSSGMLELSAGLGLLSAVGLFFVAAAIAWFGAGNVQTSPVRVPDKLPDIT